MQVAIISGGLATRLKPHTDNIPKAMIVVDGRPFLEHQIELLRGAGVLDIVLCLGHQAELIKAHFGDGAKFGVSIHTSNDGSQLLGTAGALKKAEPLLQVQFFVLDGDAYLKLDYRKVFDSFH